MNFFGLFKVSKGKKKKEDVFLISEDIKNIDHLLVKRHKTVEEIEYIDQKIILIQKSTKTLIKPLNPIHNRLRQEYKWYYNWHLSPYAKPIHILFLLFYIFSLGLALNYLIKPVTKVMAETTYDFPRWEWVTPQSTGNTLNKVITCSDGTSWIAGGAGTILKSNDSGSTWQQNYSGTTNSLQDIVCISPNNIIAIGDSGTLLRYDGLAWTSITSGTTRYFKSITVVDFTHVLVVGDTVGQIVALTYNGSTWNATDVVGGNNYYYSVTTIDSTHALAVGGVNQLTILAYDGSTWSAINVTSGATSYFQSITVVDSTHALAVGGNGQIVALTYNGFSWSAATVASGTTNVFYSIIKVDSTHALAIGSNGQITALSYNGSTWSAANVISGTTNYFYSVVGIDTTHALAVGGSGQITALTYNGSVWSVSNVASGTTNGFDAITIVDSTHALAVGHYGQITILTYNGSLWNATNVASATSDYFYSIAIVDSTHTIAVGGLIGISSKITVLTYNGSSWSAVDVISGTTNYFYSVAVIDSTHALAVGSNGQITALTYNGSVWSVSNVVSGTTNMFLSVVNVDATHALAVGSSGQITALTYNGSAWSATTVTSGTTNGFYSITSIDSTHALAVGSLGQITALTYNGSSWSVATVTSGTTNDFYSIASIGSTHALAVGGSGQITALTYNGSSWSAATVTSGTTNPLLFITTIDSTHALAIGYFGQITALTYNGSSWSAATVTSGTTEHLFSVATIDSTHAIAMGTSGQTTTLLYNGSSWSATNTTLQTTEVLYMVAVISPSNILIVGSSGAMLHYHSPANATATKLLTQLPGQSFADDTGVFDDPGVTSVRAGENVTATIYATDGSNVLDKGNASMVGFTTTDPNDTNPGIIQLTQGGTCVQANRQAGDPECGIGTATFNFHTPGTWTVTATDTNGILIAGTSSQITVTAGPINALSFTNLSTSLGAGSPSGAVTLQAKDLYGNNTTMAADTTVNLKTTSSAGLFSTNGSTWSTGEINTTIPAGSGNVTFYYLDLTIGNPIITATGGGFTTTSSINITAGELSLSTLILSTGSIRAGEGLTASINLMNSQSVILTGKTVRLSSSREGDNTGGDQVTDGSGNASFNISSTRAGSFDLIIYDVTDNVYATVSASVQVSPGDLSSAVLTSNRRTITAGDNIVLTTNLFDRFGNSINDPTQLINFSASDTKAEFQEKNHWFFGSGIYSQTVTLKTAGSQTISASKIGSSLGNITIEVTPAAVSADVSEITSDHERIDPGTGIAIITVKLMDTFGNAVAGKEVSITSSRSEDKITLLKVTTGDDGQAGFSFSSDAQGDSIIVAQDMTDNIVLKKTLKIRVASANILDKIKESPVAQAIAKVLAPVSKAIALVGLISLLLQLLQAIPSIAPLASSVFPMLFTTASVRRRKKPWGNVFDTLTGHAVDLAVVRLYEKETDRLISTQVTDFDGRFHFLAGEGTYYIKVAKKGYNFPVKISKFKASQLSSRFGKDSDIYLGVPFSIQGKNAQINLNIPLDPIYEKLTGKIKFRKSLKEGSDWFLISISYIAIPLMLFGAAIAALSIIVKTTGLNFFTGGAYLVLLSGFLVTSRIQQNRLGQVFDSETKEPLSGAMVTVFDSEYNAIRQTQNTDKNGNFAILAQKGDYYLVISKDGYKFPSTELTSTKKQPIYTGGTINKPKPGFIGVDVPLDKK